MYDIWLCVRKKKHFSLQPGDLAQPVRRKKKWFFCPHLFWNIIFLNMKHEKSDIPSAEYRSSASLNVKKFPVDFDIFSELSNRWPLARTLLGHLFGCSGHTATWLYKKYVKWLGIKSFPDERRLTGYQYSNSVFSFLRKQIRMIRFYKKNRQANKQLNYCA